MHLCVYLFKCVCVHGGCAEGQGTPLETDSPFLPWGVGSVAIFPEPPCHPQFKFSNLGKALKNSTNVKASELFSLMWWKQSFLYRCLPAVGIVVLPPSFPVVWETEHQSSRLNFAFPEFGHLFPCIFLATYETYVCPFLLFSRILHFLYLFVPSFMDSHHSSLCFPVLFVCLFSFWRQDFSV